MGTVLALLLLATAPWFELRGDLVFSKEPTQRPARITLISSGEPYMKSIMVLNRSKFRFQKLKAGAYMIVVRLRGRGEFRESVSVGPGTAGGDGIVEVKLDTDEMRKVGGPPPGTIVSARQLGIPESANGEYQKAIEKLSTYDADGALVHLEKAVAKAPKFSEALNLVGTIHYQRGQLEEAEKSFRAAIETSRNTSFEPVVNLGGTLLSLNRPTDALEFNRRAVAARPSDPLAHCQLGWNLLRLDQMEEAGPYLEKSRALDRRQPCRAQLGLAQVYRWTGENGRAVEVLEEFVRLNPDDPEISRARAEIGETRDQPPAIPGSAKSDYQKAGLKLSQNDPEGAIPLLEKAVARTPGFIEALTLLGAIHQQQGRPKIAEKCFREVLAKNPNNFEALVRLGSALLTQKRLAEALVVNRQTVLVRPSDSGAQCQLGWNLLHLNYSADAIEYLEKARALDARHSCRPQIALGRIYRDNDEIEKAIEVLEEFTRLHPDDPDLPVIRRELTNLREQLGQKL